MSLQWNRGRLQMVVLYVALGWLATAVRTPFVAAEDPPMNQARGQDLRASNSDSTPIEIEVEVFEVSDPGILLDGGDEGFQKGSNDGWYSHPPDLETVRRDLPPNKKNETIRRLGFSRFLTSDGASVQKRLEFDHEKQSATDRKADALQISVAPRLLPGDEISLEYDLVRRDVLGDVKAYGTKRTHLGELTTLWFKSWKPQVQQSVSQLLGRHGADDHAASSHGPPKKKICFVGLENKGGQELGDFGEQIYNKIITSIEESGEFEVVDRPAVEAGLRESKSRPDELYVPSKQREFTVAMEKAEKSFDFLLFARTTTSVKNKGDYLLTLDLVNAKSFKADKASVELRKGDDANSRGGGHSWVVFINARPKTKDGQNVTIKVHESHSPISEASFFPRPGRYEMHVPEGWVGILIAGNMGDTMYPMLDSVVNIGRIENASSDGHVPLQIFAAERPVLEVVMSDDGLIQVCARRSGTASMRVQVMGLEGKPEPCDLKIIVQADTSEFDRAVKEILPGANVRIHRLNESVMMTGMVGTDDEKSLLNEIAEQFFPKILNRVKVQAGTERHTSGLEKSSPIDLMKATPPRQVIDEEETLDIPRDLVRPTPRPSDLAANASDTASDKPPKNQTRDKQKRNRLSATDAKRILEEVRSLRRDVRQLSELVERRAAQVDPQQPAKPKAEPGDLPVSPLSKTVNVKFEDMPLQKALAELSKQAEINLILDADVLDDESVRTSGRVTLEIHGVTCRSVLKLMVQPIGLDVIEREGIVVITNRRAQGKLSVIEPSPLKPDAGNQEARQNVVIRLKNSDATLIAKSIQEFYQSQRDNAEADPNLVSSIDQLEREVVVVPDATNNSLLLSTTPRYFKIVENMILRLDAAKQPPVSNELMVRTYAVADLVIPLPSEGVAKPPGAKDWLAVVDRIKESVDANQWEENGGCLSLRVHETTLSLVVRADPKSHAQIAATLDAMRRVFDRQIVIKTRMLQTSDDSVLEESGLKVLSDRKVHLAKLNKSDADRLDELVRSQQGKVLNGPNITIVDGQVAEVHSGLRSPDSDGEDLHIYVRGRLGPNQTDVLLNLACNPKDVINALAIHSHRIPSDGCVVFDMTDEFHRGRSGKPKGRVLVVVGAHVIDASETLD